MGPEFARASTRIGRERLPDGYVAVLGDAGHLRRVIRELWLYAAIQGAGSRLRFGVVFRRVSQNDRNAVVHRIVTQFGAAALTNTESVKPSQVVGLAEVRGAARIVYESKTGEGLLVLVFEVQRSRKAIVLKTMYKRK